MWGWAGGRECHPAEGSKQRKKTWLERGEQHRQQAKKEQKLEGDIYIRTVYTSCQVYIFVSNHHFHFPAHLVGGFTLSGLLLDKPWPQVSSLFPPGTCLYFCIAHKGSAFPLLVDFHGMPVANSSFRAFRYSIFKQARRSPYEHALGET